MSRKIEDNLSGRRAMLRMETLGESLYTLPLSHAPCTIQEFAFHLQIQHMYGSPVIKKFKRKTKKTVGYPKDKKSTFMNESGICGRKS